MADKTLAELKKELALKDEALKASIEEISRLEAVSSDAKKKGVNTIFVIHGKKKYKVLGQKFILPKSAKGEDKSPALTALKEAVKKHLPEDTQVLDFRMLQEGVTIAGKNYPPQTEVLKHAVAFLIESKSGLLVSAE